jgi:hypothetical protein
MDKQKKSDSKSESKSTGYVPKPVGEMMKDGMLILVLPKQGESETAAKERVAKDHDLTADDVKPVGSLRKAKEQKEK